MCVLVMKRTQRIQKEYGGSRVVLMQVMSRSPRQRHEARKRM